MSQMDQDEEAQDPELVEDQDRAGLELDPKQVAETGCKKR